MKLHDPLVQSAAVTLGLRHGMSQQLLNHEVTRSFVLVQSSFLKRNPTITANSNLLEPYTL